MASPQDFAPFSLAEVLGTVASLRNAEQRGRFMDAQTEGQKTENKVKLHAVGAAMARALASRMNATRLQPGTPEFQATLEKFGAPMKAELQSMGFPVQDGPMNWNAIQSLAAMNPGKIHSAFDGKAQDNTTHKFYLDENGNPVDTNIEVRTPNLPTGMTLMPNASGPTAAVIPGVPAGQTQIKRAEQHGKELGSVHKTVGPEGQERLVSGDALLGNSPIPVGPGAGRYPKDKPPSVGALLNAMTPEQTKEWAAIEDIPGADGIAKRDAFIRSLPSRQQTPGILSEGPTPAAVEKQKEDVKNEAKLDLEKREGDLKKSQSAQNVTTLLETKIDGKSVEELIKEATGSGFGAGIDAVSRSVGRSSPSAQAAAKLETLAGHLTFSMPRMEGPQSNFDADLYKTMAGKIGDRTVPALEKLGALQTLKAIGKKYAGINKKPANNEPSIDDLLNKYK